MPEPTAMCLMPLALPRSLCSFEKSKPAMHWKKMLFSFTSLKNLLLQTNHRHTNSVPTSLTKQKLLHMVGSHRSIFGADKGMQAIES
jgi:hypothetical protein